MNSVRHTLLLWLLIGVTAVFAVAAQLVYFQARDEAYDMSDVQMRYLVASLPIAGGVRSSGSDAPLEESMVVQIWDDKGALAYESHSYGFLPQKLDPGFYNVDVGNLTWRVYSARRGKTTIQVSQLLSARKQMVAGLAMHAITPLFFLFPVLVGLIWITVVQGLASVRRAADDVRSRDDGLLSAIYDDELPHEIRPLTQEFNNLLSRLRHAMDAQGTFIADAAHELKTPLTALKLQLQLAERAQNDESRQSAFGDLRKGLERATHLVQQLLTLARQDPSADHQVRERVDMSALVHSVISGFAAAASVRNIDLGIKADTRADVMGNVDALRIMLNSLIDNAIRYTPDGGQIDVSIESYDGCVSVAIEDTGPGIPEADLNRVIDRFYRVPGTGSGGSGLGLSIVKQIASSHKADITLFNAKRGLHACVTFRAPA